MKICKDCKLTKPLNEFPVSAKSKITGKIWYRGRCRKCHNLKFRPPTGIISSTRFKKGHIPWTKKVEGGRHSLVYKEWQKKIFERDGYTCKECFSKDKKLHSHHIKNWNDSPELRFCLDNGITLCPTCHMRYHGKIDGFKSGNTGWWKGKKMTMKQRKKLSDSHLGQKAWNAGKKYSPEFTKKMVEAKRKTMAIKRQKKLEWKLSIEGEL